MQAWRRDVRRIALINNRDRKTEIVDNTIDLEPIDNKDNGQYGTWPLLKGTQDLVPNSSMLQILNGYEGKAPFAMKRTVYFAVASIFTFDNGVPNPVLRDGLTRKDIIDWTFKTTPNDLVVPTHSVFSPSQGSDACQRFPIPKNRYIILAPSCNATHVGLFRIDSVRKQIYEWIATTK